MIGTKKLFDLVDDNPIFEFHPTSYTNDPSLIARNDNMVAINSALQIDLTGQVCSDSIGNKFYSGFGGQVDFLRGASRSKGGKPIIAISSTAKSGTISRIVPMLSPGAGVVTSRGLCDTSSPNLALLIFTASRSASEPRRLSKSHIPNFATSFTNIARRPSGCSAPAPQIVPTR